MARSKARKAKASKSVYKNSNNIPMSNSEAASTDPQTSSARTTSSSKPSASSTSSSSSTAAESSGGRQSLFSAVPPIPLLTGQIVNELNTINRATACLTNRVVKSEIEVELSAIISSLQEMQTMVQQSKAAATANGSFSGGAQQVNGKPATGNNMNRVLAQVHYLLNTMNHTTQKPKSINDGNQRVVPLSRKEGISSTSSHQRLASVVEPQHRQQHLDVGQPHGSSSSSTNASLSALHSPNARSVE